MRALLHAPRVAVPGPSRRDGGHAGGRLRARRVQHQAHARAGGTQHEAGRSQQCAHERQHTQSASMTWQTRFLGRSVALLCVAVVADQALLSAAFAAEAGSLLPPPPLEGTESALVQKLLQKSRENKEQNDKERADYSRQYSGYFQVLKATSSYVPASQAERDKLGYSRPAECGLPFFAASDLCKAFDVPP